jgi:hypothetical protein
MSLLELVVALAISGVAISTAVAGTSLIVRSRQVAADAAAEALHAAQARDLITDMLAGAMADERGNGFIAENRAYDDEPDDRLLFVTRHVPGRTTATAEAELSIDRDPASVEKGFTLSYGGGMESVRRMQLAAGAESFNVRFRSDDQWLDQWPFVGQLPQALELTLYGSTLPRLLRVPIVVLVHQGVE